MHVSRDMKFTNVCVPASYFFFEKTSGVLEEVFHTMYIMLLCNVQVSPRNLVL